jgi:glycosyltransferase involved in cell wall biosynthesis
VIDNNKYFVEAARLLAAQHPYDLIHVHDWLVAEAGIALKHEWRAPLVATMHATERGRWQGNLPNPTSVQVDRLEWKLTYEAWEVIACSQFMRAELVRYFETPAEKIAVIPNGIDCGGPASCSPDELQRIRAEYAPNGERLLFFVGRIVHEKGVHVLVRAMPRILAKYPNTRLLVAGKNSQSLYPLAYELGVEQSVDFLGFITDEQRDCLYQVVDAAIFPSLYEPFGIVALEAMAHGCSVIASDTGGLAEVVEHETSGLTVYPDDPLSIAWAVDRLFGDPAAATARRTIALERANNDYRWDLIAAYTVRLYNEVVCRRRNTDW